MTSFLCITGAAGGLGKAFAVECAARGWNLFLTDISETALTELATALSNTYGVEVYSHRCDLTEINSRAALFEYLQQRRFSFWGLINVAGIDFEGPFSQKTRAQIRNIVRVNIEATLEMSHAILELRHPKEIFRLINVSSLASFYPMPVKATYAASKRFLLDFSLALREEIRPSGGTVTVLCPAGLPTTPSAIRGIEAQGWAGRITTQNVGIVAARTIDSALKGRAIYIPGFTNRLLRFLGSLVPAQITAFLVGMRWKTAHQKSHVEVYES